MLQIYPPHAHRIEETCVIGPNDRNVAEYTILTFGSKHCNVLSSLAWHINSGLVTNNITATSPDFGQVEGLLYLIVPSCMAGQSAGVVRCGDMCSCHELFRRRSRDAGACSCKSVALVFELLQTIMPP